MVSEELFDGLIIKVSGADYIAATDRGEVWCSLRGRFRLGESRESAVPVVGDTVVIRGEKRHEARGPRGLIVEIHPRASMFARAGSSRKMNHRILAANLHQVILVFATRTPDLSCRLLDRMIVAAEQGRIVPVVCVNKMDLAESDGDIAGKVEPYRRIGYRVILSSAETGRGVDDLRAVMAGAVSILAGPSGSGKTSLIARVQPGLELAIGNGCTKAGKGRHTTSHFELHRLDIGGYLGDTPGIREFGIWGVTKRTLAGYFRDFDAESGGCRFAGCTHSHEPDCAVKSAVAAGLVSSERYKSYLRILDTVPDE